MQGLYFLHFHLLTFDKEGQAFQKKLDSSWIKLVGVLFSEIGYTNINLNK